MHFKFFVILKRLKPPELMMGLPSHRIQSTTIYNVLFHVNRGKNSAHVCRTRRQRYMQTLSDSVRSVRFDSVCQLWFTSTNIRYVLKCLFSSRLFISRAEYLDRAFTTCHANPKSSKRHMEIVREHKRHEFDRCLHGHCSANVILLFIYSYFISFFDAVFDVQSYQSIVRHFLNF